MSERTPEEALQRFADWMSPMDPAEAHSVYGLTSKHAHEVCRQLRVLRTELAAANEKIEELNGLVHFCPKCGEYCKECQCIEKELAAAKQQLDSIAHAQRNACHTEYTEGVWWAKGSGIVAGPQATEQDALLEVAENWWRAVENRESELAEAKQRVAELEANLDAGRELMRVAWREFNAIRARDGAPAGICHDYWNELTEGLRELIGDDATPWMTRAARALVQPYESRVGRLTSQLVDMELRAIAAENKLADRITHIPGKEDDDGEMH